MSRQPTLRILSLLALAVGLTVASTGCSTFHPRQLDVLHLFGPRKPKPPAEGEPAFTMVLAPSGGRANTYPVPLEDPITVQQALELTGTLNYFRRQNVYIERAVPAAGRAHRMSVTFDYASQSITPETDYAILPGDRLVVTEDTTTLLEQTLEKVGAPLKVMTR